MKKVLFAVIILMLLCSVCFAKPQTIDLEIMTFDELVALKALIDLTIMNLDDWQEVIVPQGIYEVGIDIPAKHWTIRPMEGSWACVEWGKSLNNTKTSTSGFIDGKVITSVTNFTYDANSDRTCVDWKLKKGTFIEISGGNVVFTPFAGKQPLEFK